jgi:hypothetical protein
MGPDHPVAAIVSTAATPSVQALDLFCDELALPAALATDGSLAVACRLGQEIRVGTLGIELDQ